MLTKSATKKIYAMVLVLIIILIAIAIRTLSLSTLSQAEKEYLQNIRSDRLELIQDVNEDKEYVAGQIRRISEQAYEENLEASENALQRNNEVIIKLEEIVEIDMQIREYVSDEGLLYLKEDQAELAEHRRLSPLLANFRNLSQLYLSDSEAKRCATDIDYTRSNLEIVDLVENCSQLYEKVLTNTQFLDKEEFPNTYRHFELQRRYLLVSQELYTSLASERQADAEINRSKLASISNDLEPVEEAYIGELEDYNRLLILSLYQ